jgi:hypothetical protein
MNRFLDHYCFTDLILLVGTNPLPNYVVAQHFIKTNEIMRKTVGFDEKIHKIKKIWLVHSDETLIYADKLIYSIEKLSAEVTLNKVRLSNVSRAVQIERDLKQNIFNQLSSTDSIHLNYTGGTKTMVTHAYRSTAAIDLPIKIKYSYLSASDFSIIFDDEKIIPSNDLRKTINLDFDTMLFIHDYEKNENSKFISYNFDELKECLSFFSELVNREPNQLNVFYEKNNIDFMKNEEVGFSKQHFSFNDKSDDNVKIKQIGERFSNYNSRNLKPNKLLKSMNDKLIADHKFFAGDKFIVPSLDPLKIFDYINGFWLEDYAYNIISEIFNAEDKFKIIKNYRIRGKNWKSEINDFEIDIALLKGYQLFSFSCTISHKKPVIKHKGFEVIMRTRQIGGDEARSVIIAAGKSITECRIIQEELALDTGNSKNNIIVIGQEDLTKKKLTKKITDFVK